MDFMVLTRDKSFLNNFFLVSIEDSHEFWNKFLFDTALDHGFLEKFH